MSPFVGIYGISGSVFDLMLMVLASSAGFAASSTFFTVPIILGILLGNQMENNLRRALTISNGDWWILVESSLAKGLWAAAIIGFIAPLLIGKYLRPKVKREEDLTD
ncbi:MAG: hypothetical protein R3C97_13670 [Geminicoccaceae bacterium]